MPWLGLIIATIVPALVLVVERDLIHLASLYAIGVVGAITLNLGSTATNFQAPLKFWERTLLFIATLILFFIELTIAVEKQNALFFALIVLGTGLALRAVAKAVVPVPIPEEFLSMNALTVSEAKEIAPLYRGSSLVAIKSFNPLLLEEAALRVKARGENSVYLTYVEETPPASDLPTEVEPSVKSLEILWKAQKEMETKEITAVPIWRFGVDPGKLIADAALELGVSTVLIGTTKRSALVNLLRGDVFRSLAKHLPSDCHLVISG
jgi:nucleotide-binding universal stress UspA family protein